MKGSCICAFLAALALLSAIPKSLYAEGGAGKDLEPAGVLVLALALPSNDSESLRYATALDSALKRSLAGLGFTVADGGFANNAEEVLAFASSAKGEGRHRWLVVARCQYEEQRIAWSALLYDRADGSLVFSDTQTSYPGLTALPLIEDSAATLSAKLKELQETPASDQPISYPLRFSSGDDGAIVALGEAAATIKGGIATLPYLPLKEGQALIVTVSKEGYWPRVETIRVEGDSPILLPNLMPKLKTALSFDYGMGRLLGVEAAYRLYPEPDTFYVQLAAAPWLTYDFLPGSSPILHGELRLDAGFYPLFPPNSKFRLSLSSGISAYGTYFFASGVEDPWAFDLVLQPIAFAFEFNLPKEAFILAFRFPYSFGLASGLLPQGWLSLPISGMPFLSLGVLLK